MSRLKQLQNRDAAITAEMRSMSDALAAENRTEFNEDEQGKFDALCDESKKVQAALKVEESILANEKRLSEKTDAAQKVEKTANEAAEKAQGLEITIPPQHLSKPKYFKGDGAARDAYKSGMFLRAHLFGDLRAQRWCAENGMLAAQTEQTNTLGGILVPEELANVVITLREQYGMVRQNMRTTRMGSDTLVIPRRVSGTTAYFVSDGVATTESTKGWDGVSLTAKELAGLTRYPATLAEDAIISLADDLAQEFAYQFALKEDQCALVGDGTSTYGGIVGVTVKIDDAQHGNGVTTNGSTNGGVQVAAAGGTSFGALVLGDFEKVVGLLPQYAAPNAKWWFSRAGFASGPQRLMDAGGGNTNVTLASGSNMSFLGYPVVISQVLNSTLAADTSQIACLFGDIDMACVLGERRGIATSVSSERYFEYRQLAIQCVERFDFNAHSLGTTTAAGAMVALKKSAS